MEQPITEHYLIIRQEPHGKERSGNRFEKQEVIVVERRTNGNGRRANDQYCPMHESVVKGQERNESLLRWTIKLHIGNYLLVIGGMGTLIMFFLKGG